MTSDAAREWTDVISKPFYPSPHIGSGGNYADAELTRIADAAQYAAAQLFEIRKLLEQLVKQGETKA